MAHFHCINALFLAHGSFFQGKMVLQLSKEPSARLLKHVVRCYLRLSDNSRWFECFLYKPVQCWQYQMIITQKKTASGESSRTPDLVFWSFHRAREALRQCLPDQLKDTTFAQVLKDDTTTKRWLAQLVKNLQEGQVTDPRGIPLPPQWRLNSPQSSELEEHQRRTAQQPSRQSWTLMFLWETVDGRKGCCLIIFLNRCASWEPVLLWF